MDRLRRSLLPIILVAVCALTSAHAGDLDAARARARRLEATLHGPAYAKLLARGGAPITGIDLVGVRPDGHPVYFGGDNAPAAATIGVEALWPGGRSTLDLTGILQPTDLAVWDGGKVRETHRELVGRVTLADDLWYDDHATAVAGLLIATGIVPWARGMAYEGCLTSHDWWADTGEMADAAAELRLSNHSYGSVTGWKRSDDQWWWYGDLRYSEVEDVDFGRYSPTPAAWDDIAAAAPHYLICKSAGNDRGDHGPAAGTPHNVWDPDSLAWVESYDQRPPDGLPAGYDCLPTQATAKNILTVGATMIIYEGYAGPESVELTWYSSTGPTDDGRLKPDLVAPGDGLISCSAASDTSLSGFGGTSAAAPMACGALALLLQHHRRLQDGPDLLSSTRKGLLLHTTREAGPYPGPDYQHGWGLLDAEAAAEVLTAAAAAPGRIIEATLVPGAADTFHYWHPAAGDLRATLCWTDPAGPVREIALDDPQTVLVHDLDLRLVRVIDGAFREPWILDPDQPEAPATTGDNRRDNNEQVRVRDAARGNWLVIVSHKGTLAADQTYSLIQTGLEAVSAPVPHDPPAAAAFAAVGPNPTRGSATITLAAERPVDMRLSVFDLRGRLVRVIAAGQREPGLWRHAWDGRDAGGDPVSSGLYLLRLESPDAVSARRLTVIR